MQVSFRSVLVILLGWIAVPWLPVYAQSGQPLRAQAAVASQQVYTGESFVFQVQVQGSRSPETPDLSHFTDFDVTFAGGTDRSSSSTTIINGKVTQRSSYGYTFDYRLVAKKPGRSRIPSVEVKDGGRTTQTQAIEIEVKQGEETETLKLRSTLSKAIAYPGEAVFYDTTFYYGADVQGPNLSIPILESSQFRIEDQEHPNQSQQESLDGKSYQVMRLRKVLIPRETGTFRIPPATLSVEGMVGVRTVRDLFFGPSQRREYRRFVIPSNELTLEVREFPKAGQPAHFAGHVGPLEVSAMATPNRVAVGDPITLSVTLSGPDYVESLPAPDLLQQPGWEKQFRLPKESASGSVMGAGITFVQTIRVVDPSVREVPPIEVPYFDPERQVYRVAKSRPVRLEVTGAKVITAMDAEGVDPVDPSVREVRSLEEGIAYNYEGGDAVTAMGFLPGRWLRGPGFWGPFLVFPLLYFVLGFIIRRGEQQRADPEGHRSAKALAAFRQEVEGAGLPEEAFAAFRRYLGDRLHLKSEALTYPDVEGLLQESGVSEQLLGEVKALFDLAEGLRYSGGGREDDLGNMADRATKVVEQAEMVLREAKGGQSNVWWRRVPFLQKAAVWMCGAVFLGMGGTSWGLDEGEQEELFREGNALFRQANELAQNDRAAAQATYEKAIRRYERLLQEEAPSGKLYYNVGNAYFRQGDVGRAILSYRRAERLLPGDPNVVKNLAFARDQRVDRIDAPPRQRFLKTAFFWHHDISPRVRAALWGWTYACLWTALALVLVLRRPWLRKVGMGMGALSALLLVSLVIDAQHLGRDRGGVILADEVTARKGDSQTYEPSFDKPLHAGTEFVLLEARPGWVHIQLPDGKAGWLPDDSVGLVRG